MEIYEDDGGHIHYLEEEDECPNCKNGTLELGSHQHEKVLYCRGECGGMFRRVKQYRE